MRKKILFLYRPAVVVAIGAVLLGTPVLPANADDLQQQLIQSQKEVQQITGSVNAQNSKISSMADQVNGLKKSVQTLNASVERQQSLLDEEQSNLNDLETQQKELEDQRQEHIKALSLYLKNNYEDGASTYLSILLQSTSLSDFLERTEQITMIMGTYGKIQNDINDLDNSLNTQKDEINQKKQSIQDGLELKKTAQQTSQQALDKQQAILDQLTSAQKATLTQQMNAQAKVDRIQQLIEQEQLEKSYAAQGGISGGNTKGVSGTVAVSGGAGKVMSYASQFLGVPYVWGGTSPSGFDCSGFVQYVYNHFGVSLSRTSEQQFYNGEAVSRSNLKPGDLVFFHTYANDASHVGIYAGNNTMLDSSNGGVSYDDMNNSYWAPRYLGARRVLSQ